MPRGFLVKRLQKHSAPVSYRVRRYSDEDRSDSSSDHDGPESTGATSVAHASPDSGFSSPTLLLALKCPPSPSLPLAVSASEDRHGRSPAHRLPDPFHHHRYHHHHHFNGNNNHHHHHNHHPDPQRHSFSSVEDDDSAKPLALVSRPEPAGPFTPNLQSPFYLAGFDRLAVTPTTPNCRAAATHPSLPPPSPHKKRVAGGELDPERAHRAKPAKKSKAVRRLNFDEDKSSPVSGTIIRELGDDEEMLVVRKGDIDPTFNVVEVTEEAKAEIAKIENRIGDYICQLCRTMYDDAFGLAQHRCSRIVHVEYRCPECDKVFNCPANLASHRRWHKPRVPPVTAVNNNNNNASSPPELQSLQQKMNSVTTPTLPSAVSLTTTTTSPTRELSSQSVPQLRVKIEPSDTESNASSLPGSPRSENGGSHLLQAMGTNLNNNNSNINNNNSSVNNNNDEGQFECELCRKKFRRRAYLRKHMTIHGVANDEGNDVALRYILNTLSSTSSLSKARSSNPSPPPAPSSPSTESHPHHNHHNHHNHHLSLATERSPSSSAHSCSSPSSTTCASSPASDISINSNYPCKHCPVTFSSSPGLTRHVNKHHPSESRQVILLQLSSNAIRNAAVP